MPKILIAECKQEVSTFNPHKSRYDDFTIYFEDELIRSYRGSKAEMGGALSVFDSDSKVQLIPTYGACFATSGGTLDDEAWRRIAAEFLDGIREAPSVDGVYFSMHGAMASDCERDPEGYLIEETRKLLGDDIPIVVSLDLHGIATDRMFRNSNAIVAFHTYPHVDFFETGQRAARLLLGLLAGEVVPVTARVSLPALVRGDELITETGAIRETIEAARLFEEGDRGLSAGIFIGNPFTDVPELQSYAFAVSNGDEAEAEAKALELADLFWKQHEKMQVPLVSVDAAMSLLQAEKRGTVALVDAADATSSGASGDSNVILVALLKSGYSGKVLLPIVDSQAVDKAFGAGVGAMVETTIGGTLDTSRFKPIGMEAKVRLLSDGRIRSESFEEEWNSGRTAVLESSNFTIVASTRPVHLFDRSFFYAHGQNPKDFDAVVVKSPHCQPHMYQDWCACMINIDAPGSTSANLASLGHEHCPRPIFPLDPDVSYLPVSKIYKRSI